MNKLAYLTGYMEKKAAVPTREVSSYVKKQYLPFYKNILTEQHRNINPVDMQQQIEQARANKNFGKVNDLQSKLDTKTILDRNKFENFLDWQQKEKAAGKMILGAPASTRFLRHLQKSPGGSTSEVGGTSFVPSVPSVASVASG